MRKDYEEIQKMKSKVMEAITSCFKSSCINTYHYQKESVLTEIGVIHACINTNHYLEIRCKDQSLSYRVNKSVLNKSLTSIVCGLVNVLKINKSKPYYKDVLKLMKHLEGEKYLINDGCEGVEVRVEINKRHMLSLTYYHNRNNIELGLNSGDSCIFHPVKNYYAEKVGKFDFESIVKDILQFKTYNRKQLLYFSDSDLKNSINFERVCRFVRSGYLKWSDFLGLKEDSWISFNEKGVSEDGTLVTELDEFKLTLKA